MMHSDASGLRNVGCSIQAVQLYCMQYEFLRRNCPRNFRLVIMFDLWSVCQKLYVFVNSKIGMEVYCEDCLHWKHPSSSSSVQPAVAVVQV